MTNKPNRPVRVLFSGGVDSTVCLALAVAEYGEGGVDAVFFDYGQRHLDAEFAAARKIAQLFGVLLHTRKVRYLGGGVVDGSDLSPAGAVVPGRNSAFIASALAPGELPSAIVMGCCRDDWRAFDDCRPEFFDAERAGMAFNVKILTPLLFKSKAQVLHEAERLGVLDLVLADSWSCYAGGDEPCGECGACVALAAGVRGLPALRRPCPKCGAATGESCFHPNHGFVGAHRERLP